jgi:hypothetical protein
MTTNKYSSKDSNVLVENYLRWFVGGCVVGIVWTGYCLIHACVISISILKGCVVVLTSRYSLGCIVSDFTQAILLEECFGCDRFKKISEHLMVFVKSPLFLCV